MRGLRAQREREGRWRRDSEAGRMRETEMVKQTRIHTNMRARARRHARTEQHTGGHARTHTLAYTFITQYTFGESGPSEVMSPAPWPTSCISHVHVSCCERRQAASIDCLSTALLVAIAVGGTRGCLLGGLTVIHCRLGNPEGGEREKEREKEEGEEEGRGMGGGMREGRRRIRTRERKRTGRRGRWRRRSRTANRRGEGVKWRSMNSADEHAEVAYSTMQRTQIQGRDWKLAGIGAVACKSTCMDVLF